MGTPPAPTVEMHRLVQALEGAWGAIREWHRDLPPAVVIVGVGGGRRRGKLTLGHWSTSTWKVNQPGQAAAVGEVLIAGEGLYGGPEEAMSTLLHEAAHALATARGLQDTSRQGRYHNATYKALAIELGLAVAPREPLGWASTSLKPETAARYQEQIRAIREALVGWRTGYEDRMRARQPPAEGAAAPRERLSGDRRLNLRCGCPRPRHLRVAPAMVELGPILCGVCGEPFNPPPGDGVSSPDEILSGFDKSEQAEPN